MAWKNQSISFEKGAQLFKEATTSKVASQSSKGLTNKCPGHGNIAWRISLQSPFSLGRTWVNQVRRLCVSLCGFLFVISEFIGLGSSSPPRLKRYDCTEVERVAEVHTLFCPGDRRREWRQRWDRRLNQEGREGPWCGCAGGSRPSIGGRQQRVLNCGTYSTSGNWPRSPSASFAEWLRRNWAFSALRSESWLSSRATPTAYRDTQDNDMSWHDKSINTHEA